jgi:hypothetical protein
MAGGEIGINPRRESAECVTRMLAKIDYDLNLALDYVTNI